MSLIDVQGYFLAITNGVLRLDKCPDLNFELCGIIVDGLAHLSDCQRYLDILQLIATGSHFLGLAGAKGCIIG